MRYLMTLVVSATTAALSLVGCGSDSDTGSANNAGSGGSPISECVGAYADYTPADFLAQTEADKACSGSTDATSVCANNLPLIGGQCGKGCLGMGSDAEQAECVAECIQAELTKSHSPPLTEECMACYTTDIACARKNCVAQCGLDPKGEECFTCRLDNGCVEGFYTCSGLPEPTAR
jgi:hypothetical protein